MDSGAWFRWKDVEAVGKEALPPWTLPDGKPFELHVSWSLASIGYMDKERFQFSVTPSKDSTNRTKKQARALSACVCHASHVWSHWLQLLEDAPLFCKYYGGGRGMDVCFVS